jgi:AraC-like DNA-binding protein
MVKESREYVRPHAHPALEIIHYRGGKGVSVINGRKYPVCRNMVAVIPAGVAHDQENHDPLTSFCIGVADSRLESLQGCYADPAGTLRRPIEQLFNEVERRDAGYQQVIQGLLLEIGGLLRRIATAKAPPAANRAIVSQALSIIREREGRVSLKGLSGELFISKDYLRHLLTEETGQSPIRHIISMRIEKAKGLLQSGLSVKAAAIETGFEDVNYFSRIFKKETGRSPSRFSS